MALNARVNMDELGLTWREVVLTYSGLLPRHLPGETVETTEMSVKIGVLLSENQP
jgi:hypothetical protein